MARNQEGLEKQLRAARENLRKKQQKRRMERGAARKAAQLAKDREEQLRAKDEELKKMRQNLKEEKEKARSLEEQMKNSREKDTELARLRRQAAGKIGFADEGSLKWNVNVESIGEEPLFSPFSPIGGVPFRIRCCHDHTDAGEKYLSLHLNCSGGSHEKTFSACVAYTRRLASRKYPEALRVFDPVHRSWGRGDFMKWANLIDPTKGYIKDGCITLEFDVKLIYFYKNAIADFSSADPLLSDVTLIVGEQEFHDNKIYLAHFSQYFKALFFSGFSEKNKDRVELPEVDAEEFEELLKIIHTQRTKTNVTKDNVAYLLRLGDFFDVEVVLWECIDFLKISNDVTLADKFKLTEQYRLPELQHHLVENMKSAETFKQLVASPSYAGLTDSLKAFLLEKHFKLHVAQ